MVKNNGKPTSERISDEIYSTPLVQPQKITKVTKKSAKPTKKSVSNFWYFLLFLFMNFLMFYRHEFMNYKTKCTRHQPESKMIFMKKNTNFLLAFWIIISKMWSINEKRGLNDHSPWACDHLMKIEPQLKPFSSLDGWFIPCLLPFLYSRTKQMHFQYSFFNAKYEGLIKI